MYARSLRRLTCFNPLGLPFHCPCLHTAVDRWQTGYVRYHRAGEAHVSQGGWSAHVSRQNIEVIARSGLDPMLPEMDSLHAMVFSPMAPEAASIRIIEAPASFALPVKQDRSAQLKALLLCTPLVSLPFA